MEKFIITQKNNIWYGTFPALEEAGFVNACSCRLHGKSDVVEGTLNLALHVGDDVEKVLRNRKAFAKAIGVDANCFTTCQQVHGSKVVQVTKELVGSGAVAFTNTIADADALITNLHDVPLMLFYADCVPVLLADLETGAYSTDFYKKSKDWFSIILTTRYFPLTRKPVCRKLISPQNA